MRLFRGRYRRVEGLVMDHLACVRTAADVFTEGARAYVRDGDWAEAVELAAQTRRAEAHADDVRRKVLGALVAGAIFHKEPWSC